MATLKRRLARKNDSGTYDPVHLETSSDLVVRPDGTTAEDYMSTIHEGTPVLPVLSADPASPKTGQMWMVTG